MIDDAEREYLRQEAAAIEAYQRGAIKPLAPFRNALPSGYVSRSDGCFEKCVTFEWGKTRPCRATEVLVRSASGRLLRVERTANALAHRKTKPATSS